MKFLAGMPHSKRHAERNDRLTFEIVKNSDKGMSTTATAILFAVIATASVLCQWHAWAETPVYAGGSFFASIGLAAFARTIWPHVQMRPMAIACIICSGLWSAQWLTTWDRSFLPVVGAMANMFFWSVGATGFLLSPRSNRLLRWEKLLVAGFLVSAPLQILIVFVSRPGRHGYSPTIWWPTIVDTESAYQATEITLWLAWMVLAFGMTFAAWIRIRQMKPMDRVLAIPVMGSICLVGLISAVTCYAQPFPPARENAAYFVFSLVVFAIPIGLAIAASARTIRRFTLTEKLSRRLARKVLSGEAIQREFQELLGDDTLEVFYWSEILNAYVDSSGAEVRLPDSRRFLAKLQNASDEPLAVIVGDQMLVDHVAMLESLLTASIVAIENVQLQASVKAQLEQVRVSRSRIMQATLEERRRIERDLHDGVQQRLLGVSAQMGVLARKIDEPGLVRGISAEIRGTIDDLRRLANGIHPPELRQFGLRGAIDVVAERLPLDVANNIPDTRFGAAIEATLYFVACEALTNVVKHAQATHVEVTTDVTTKAVQLEIRDDGVGGADSSAGMGLIGCDDRVKSVGGVFEVGACDVAGTLIRVTVPL